MKYCVVDIKSTPISAFVIVLQEDGVRLNMEIPINDESLTSVDKFLQLIENKREKVSKFNF